MSGSPVWVIGRSGLLGSALARLHPGDFQGAPVDWGDPIRAAETLRASLERFSSLLGDAERWTVYWAAGVGAIGSDPARYRDESHVLAQLLDSLAKTPGSGAFFFASSASVYGGSSGPPFTESTAAAPLNAYASAKHEQEQLVSDALTGRLPHVIGRISTLYGPGQNLTKGQGLVSRMCLQAALRQPVSLFVPIDTLRDYIQVDDAAEVIRRFVDAARDDRTGRIRVVASGTSMTIAALAAHVRTVAHKRIGISQAAIAPSGAHVRDLRVATEHGAELGAMRWTSTPAAIDTVYRDIVRQIARGEWSTTDPG